MRGLRVILSFMQSKATTVKDYLAALPDDRRHAIEAIRKVILANLDKGYREMMQYGMMCYSVPHEIYPAGYHCDPKQPLPFAGLASQKNYMSLYLFGFYTSDGMGGDETRWFRKAWMDTGRKLDMGKSCIRFNSLEDVPLEVVGEAIRRIPVKRHIEFYEAALAMPRTGRPEKKTTSKKPATKKTPGKKAPVKKTAKKTAVRKKSARRA